MSHEHIIETILGPLAASGELAGGRRRDVAGSERAGTGRRAQMGGCVGRQLFAYDGQRNTASGAGIQQSDTALEYVPQTRRGGVAREIEQSLFYATACDRRCARRLAPIGDRGRNRAGNGSCADV